MNENAATAPIDVKPVTARRRRRARFSVLALVWILTVAALGIGLYRAGQEVVPLRRSVAQLRKELGYFPVHDQTATHFRRVRVKFPTAWQWRLFLPRSRTYTLQYYLGSAPEPKLIGQQRWFDMLRSQSRAMQEPLESGEFGYEALLTEYDGRSWLRAGKLADEGETYSLPPGFDWLLDETAWIVSSDASYEEVRAIDAAQPFILLHIERSVHADESENGDSDGTAAGNASPSSTSGQRFVVWIDAK